MHVDPLLELCVLPAEGGQEGDEDGGGPDQEDHQAHRTDGPGVDVVHLGHRPEPAGEKKGVCYLSWYICLFWKTVVLQAQTVWVFFWENIVIYSIGLVSPKPQRSSYLVFVTKARNW